MASGVIIEEPYYENDDVTFRVNFTISGTAQTPDAGTALAKIIQRNDGTVLLAETAATISTTIVYYKYTNLTVGNYRIFLTAKFNSGEDERTGYIDFNVIKKGK